MLLVLFSLCFARDIELNGINRLVSTDPPTPVGPQAALQPEILHSLEGKVLERRVRVIVGEQTVVLHPQEAEALGFMVARCGESELSGPLKSTACVATLETIGGNKVTVRRTSENVSITAYDLPLYATSAVALGAGELAALLDMVASRAAEAG